MRLLIDGLAEKELPRLGAEPFSRLRFAELLGVFFLRMIDLLVE